MYNDLMDSIGFVKGYDPAVGEAMGKDERLVEPFPAGIRNDVGEGVPGCSRRRERAQRGGENREGEVFHAA